MTRRATRRRGTTLVEFALLVPMIFGLLFAIMEFGWMARNNLMLANATREGARTASLGKSTSEIKARIINGARPLVVREDQIRLTYSTDNGTNYTTTVGDNGTRNNAPIGSMVRIEAIWPNQSLTAFFPILNGRVLNLKVTMRREA